MATTYKSLSTNDIVTTKTLLHEAIPITGTILSGTYVNGSNELSIKNYTHGMFQSVYDYPYLSSSANHIFDVSMGLGSGSALTAGSITGKNMENKKKNIYNQMAQVLMGYDSGNRIRRFDKDGDLVGTTTDLQKEVVFINFARLLTKDEIKKGSFQLDIGVTPSHNLNGTAMFADRVRLADTNAQNDYRVNSPAGDYGILYADSTAGTNLTTDDGTTKAGLIFYQAGIAVISASLFLDADDGGILSNSAGTCEMNSAGDNIKELFVSGAISASCDAIRQRIYNVQFNNTTELNSTVYFCRAHHNEFNYSTNPTYLSSSQLVVKNIASDTPVSYITTVGLYSADNELLAIAKLSEPLKKDPSNELTMRVRLDY
tara:strand:+ start:1116 stop:2231 length:1116 start_codon:yes stop_codon:yes gene_type:complete